jgi:hypothetical protein
MRTIFVATHCSASALPLESVIVTAKTSAAAIKDFVETRAAATPILNRMARWTALNRAQSYLTGLCRLELPTMAVKKTSLRSLRTGLYLKRW